MIQFASSRRILANLVVASTLLLGPGLLPAQQPAPGADVRSWRDRQACLMVDVREANDFARAHISGSVNIPLAELRHRRIPSTERLVLVDNDLSGRTARLAAESLKAAGFPTDRLFVLRGGVDGWEVLGEPLAAASGRVDRLGPDPISPDDLAEALDSGMAVQVVDVRSAEAAAKSPMPRAVSVPAMDTIAQSRAQGGTRPRDAAISREEVFAAADAVLAALPAARVQDAAPVVVIDDGSGLAESLVFELRRRGVGTARSLDRGFPHWADFQARRAGQPLQIPRTQINDPGARAK